MRKKRIFHWLLCILIINVIISLVLYNVLEEKRSKQVVKAIDWFYEEYIKDSDPCYIDTDLSVSSNSIEQKLYLQENLMCAATERTHWEADIFIEKDMNSLKIYYPKYIYPVSGFLQLVTVNSWKVKRLKVIIMPHSHQDPGWRHSLLTTFMTYSKNTINNIVDMLSMNPNTKFIWSEVVFLYHWWNVADNMRKEKLKKLIKNGQVEITTGGWVMTDEGTAHFTAMLDQLIEGHQWVKDNLDAEPRSGWAVDPFGHSPTMPYLLKHSGIDSMVIQRVHYSIKQHLASRQDLEFIWTQAWESGHSSDILCHMIPFLSYAIQHSCGPDPSVCCQFDFFQKQCYYGNQKVGIKKIDDNNIHALGMQLWEQFQKKAELFKSNVILVPHGDDFRYSHPTEWYNQMNGIETLMRYINSRPNLQTEVKFGTLSDYFTEVRKSKTKFSSLSGDFFTYADRGDNYWSGYFSSRPHFKHLVRRMQDFLRSLEILFSYSLAISISKNAPHVQESLKEKIGNLTNFRKQVALAQHHDAITGTSANKVMGDYGRRLHSSYVKASKMMEETMSHVLQMYEQNSEMHQQTISLTVNWTHPKRLIGERVLDVTSPKQVLLFNSLNAERECVIRLLTNKVNVKVTAMSKGLIVPHQMSPVIENGINKEDVYELSFITSLPGLSISKFLLNVPAKDDGNHNLAQVQIIKPISEKIRFGVFPANFLDMPKFSISNKELTATFFSCGGRLQYVTKHNSIRYRSEVKLMTYGTGSWSNPFSDKSGAYLFLPDGNAKNLNEPLKYLYVIKGPMYSSVIVGYTSVTQTYTLYKINGPDGMGIHIENIADLTNSSAWDNKELVMRVVTDIKDRDNHICVDLNGFQMHRKKTRKKLPIQGNFFPMTSMAFIESDTSRLSLLASESHGVASLSPGWLEVVLDRRLIQDDWRGLSEGIKDNVPARSHFVLMFEDRNTTRSQHSSLACYPTPSSAVVSSQLKNHVISMTLPFEDISHWTPIQLSSAAQREINLLNLRFLSLKGDCLRVLLIVHSSQVDCSFPVILKHSDNQITDLKFKVFELFKDNMVKSVEQTTLTGVKVIKSCQPDEEITLKPMEIQTFRLTIC